MPKSRFVTSGGSEQLRNKEHLLFLQMADFVMSEHV